MQRGWRTGSFSSAYDSLVNCTCAGLFSKQQCYQLFFCQNPKFLKKKLLTHMKPLELYFRHFSEGEEVRNLKIVKLLAWKVIISNHSPLQGSLGGVLSTLSHPSRPMNIVCTYNIIGGSLKSLWDPLQPPDSVSTEVSSRASTLIC